MNATSDRNKDAVVATFTEGLVRAKLHLREAVDAEKRNRSLILSGLPESTIDMLPSAKQFELESQISETLDHIGIEDRPVETHRMGKRNDTHSRLVKVVLLSKSLEYFNAQSLMHIGCDLPVLKTSLYILA